MKTKICSRCEKEKPIEEFSFWCKDIGKRNSLCKRCKNEYNIQHYKNNKSRYTELRRKRKQLRKRYVRLYKILSGCEFCGENHPACLDLHHKQRKMGYKTEICWMIDSGISIERIKEEIKKCIVLCSNCHRKLHWNDGG